MKLLILLSFSLYNAARCTNYGGSGQFYYAVGRILFGFAMGDLFYPSGEPRNTAFKWGQLFYTIAFVYFFSGTSKLVISGVDWGSGELFKAMIRGNIAQYSGGKTNALFT